VSATQAMVDPRQLSVLFVDDEPAILELLPRVLADRRGNWRMRFAESAAKGLEWMSREPFDVVVSDLKMPGMNGIEFLKEVRERYPLSARIIYSSYSDQRSILECVGIIHQFLPKPCPLEIFKSSIERAAMIRTLLPNLAMREKVSKMERVLSMPPLYLELVHQLQSEETFIEDIAMTVSKDIGMTAQILKIVNSAFFGLAQPTSNLAEAIGYLGIDSVKYLVLAVGIFSQFQSRKLGGISLETLWQHSVRTGNAARLITKSEGGGCQMADDALAGGLLHDLGKLVMASAYPDRYEDVGRKAAEERTEWLVEERKAFGFDHAEVGGYLLGLWGLPPAVVEAVAFHHFPTKSEAPGFTALTAVHAANVLVQTQRPAHGGIVPPQIDLLYLAKIGKVNSPDKWRVLMDDAQTI
jgi:HD-like signal output (HDOD) protein